MFNQETWHNSIVECLNDFARNPWQDVMVHGASTLLGYLALRTLHPFLDAFQHEPIQAVLALSTITQGEGANYIVRRASQLRFQGARLLEREMLATSELRDTVERLMVALNMIHLARQRLNSSRDEWMRQTLMYELQLFPPEAFGQIRQLLEDPGWKLRYDAIQRLKHQHGNFTPSQLILLSEGLKDSVSEVRTVAARRLGEFSQTPPLQMIKALIHVALHDCDMKTRNAAARSLGVLRERIGSPEILDILADHLTDGDCFVRSATAMLLTELGDMAGIPKIISKLVSLLKDSDPYVREAAAIALGRMGKAAVNKEVMDALTNAGQDVDSDVHEAAVESLLQLRRMRASMPVSEKDIAHLAHAESTSPAQKRAEPNEKQVNKVSASAAKGSELQFV